MSRHPGAEHERWMREGAAAFKEKILRMIDNIFTSELGDEEGNGYVLGPAFKPDTEDNMLALKVWIESIEP